MIFLKKCIWAAAKETGFRFCGSPAENGARLHMERIYRGYPQGLAAAKEQPMLQPYMLYNRQEQIPFLEVPDAGKWFQIEQEYFKGLYPLSMRRWQRLAEEESQQHDYPGSPMYDEYPDREFLYQARDRMVRRSAEWGQEKDDRNRDLAFLLLLGEISRRRTMKKNTMPF